MQIDNCTLQILIDRDACFVALFSFFKFRFSICNFRGKNALSL